MTKQTNINRETGGKTLEKVVVQAGYPMSGLDDR